MVICEALQVAPEMLLTGRGRTEMSDGLPYIENGTDTAAEIQLVNGYRSFSDEKKRRLMAYINMLENTKE